MSEYSFLRFDANIPSQPPPGVHRQSTHILTPTQKSGHSCYVNLAGVSVGNSRVPSVTGEMFRRRS